MEFLKQLLGELFKEGMTLTELDPILKSKFTALQTERDNFKKTSETNSSEASSWKKKYTETLSAAEQERLHYQELEATNANLVKQSKISEQMATYTAIGYNSELAKKAATALVEGNMTEVINCQKEYNDKVKADYDARLIENTPTPPAGKKAKITKDDFDKMGYTEMVEFAKSNPTEYAEFTK